MQRLKVSTLSVIKLKRWISYVDETFVIIKKDGLENTQNLINNAFGDKTFTMEHESNNKLLSLDAFITRTKTGIREAQVFWKPTYTYQILNYISKNPRTHSAENNYVNVFSTHTQLVVNKRKNILKHLLFDETKKQDNE